MVCTESFANPSSEWSWRASAWPLLFAWAWPRASQATVAPAVDSVPCCGCIENEVDNWQIIMGANCRLTIVVLPVSFRATLSPPSSALLYSDHVLHGWLIWWKATSSRYGGHIRRLPKSEPARWTNCAGLRVWHFLFPRRRSTGCSASSSTCTTTGRRCRTHREFTPHFLHVCSNFYRYP